MAQSTARIRSLAVAAIAALGACSSPTPISDAVTLQCPTPGELPFRVMSHGFQTASNTTLAENDPRNKDQADDTIGNPGGMTANNYFNDTDPATTAPIDYRGLKARTPSASGLLAAPLPGENVSLWTYDTTDSKWQTIGRTTTGSDGTYDLPSTGFVAANAAPIFSVLEADDSCAAHYDYLWPAGSKVIVFDIDGTLTTSNNELIMQISDASYVPAMMGAANTLVQTWAMKGYPVIYLTARLQVFRPETRAWLDQLGFPDGPVITANTEEDASVFKTAWLMRMVNDFGWVPYAAYGNEDTDVAAYANVSIPLDHTFIVGPSGGDGGTVAIPNMDFTQHIATFVDAQPDN